MVIWGWMLAATTATAPVQIAAAEPLPPEVASFIDEREACEHFRGEPTEGSSPAQVERREFVLESVEIYCAGTDRRLAALRHRYRDDPAVIAKLQRYEDRIEESCDAAEVTP